MKRLTERQKFWIDLISILLVLCVAAGILAFNTIESDRVLDRHLAEDRR